MDRISEKQLQGMCDRLNGLTGSPVKPYIDGVAQIGNFHISHAYGGVSLGRISNQSGGTSDPLFQYGHCPKRELYSKIYCFIQGIELQLSKTGGDV